MGRARLVVDADSDLDGQSDEAIAGGKRKIARYYRVQLLKRASGGLKGKCGSL